MELTCTWCQLRTTVTEIGMQQSQVIPLLLLCVPRHPPNITKNILDFSMKPLDFPKPNDKGRAASYRFSPSDGMGHSSRVRLSSADTICLFEPSLRRLIGYIDSLPFELLASTGFLAHSQAVRTFHLQDTKRWFAPSCYRMGYCRSLLTECLSWAYLGILFPRHHFAKSLQVPR